ncbi:MAG: hypothetical protein U5K69_21550 [Balneolaceae bacterium]|nr:hypothetical protein [Balneolaceae bacterium]
MLSEEREAKRSLVYRRGALRQAASAKDHCQTPAGGSQLASAFPSLDLFVPFVSRQKEHLLYIKNIKKRFIQLIPFSTNSFWVKPK